MRYRFSCAKRLERPAPNGDTVLLVSSRQHPTNFHTLRGDWIVLAQLFDGTRSVEEVMDHFYKEAGVRISRDALNEFIAELTKLELLHEVAEAPPPPAAGLAGANGRGKWRERIAAQRRRAADAQAADQGAAAAARQARPVEHATSEERADAVAAARLSEMRADAQAQGGPKVVLPLPVGPLLPAMRMLVEPFFLTPILLALIAVALLTGYGLWRHYLHIAFEWKTLGSPAFLATSVIGSFLLVNVLGQLARAAVFARLSGRAPRFGVTFFFSFVPGFHVDLSRLRTVRSAAYQRRIVAASLLLKLLIFVVAGLLFLMTKDRGGTTAELALVMGTVAGITLLISINPLVEREGYYLLISKLDTPYLRERAVMAWFGIRHEELREKFGLTPISAWVLLTYGAAAVAFLAFITYMLTTSFASWLETQWGGLGVVIFVVAATAMFVPPGQRIYTAYRRLKKEGSRLGVSQGAPRKGKKQPNYLFRYGLPATILVIMFLPYPYETSGGFELLPPKQQQITAEVSGQVVAVNYDTGDWVTAGSVIAELDATNQKQMVASTEELVQKQRATAEHARIQAEFAQKEYDRISALHRTRHVSDQLFDSTEKQLEAARQSVEVTTAELARLEQQLTFNKEELERTKIRMPFDGRLVTSLLRRKVGIHLREGEPFAVAEDARTIQAQVKVPEADIGEVDVGARVRLKVWAYPTETFVGRVTSIDPTAVKMPYGNVVLVLTDVPNTDYVLKSGMTGQAKVSAGDKFVVVAFTRMIVRFLLVELWSWIP